MGHRNTPFVNILFVRNKIVGMKWPATDPIHSVFSIEQGVVSIVSVGANKNVFIVSFYNIELDNKRLGFKSDL